MDTTQIDIDNSTMVEVPEQKILMDQLTVYFSKNGLTEKVNVIDYEPHSDISDCYRYTHNGVPVTEWVEFHSVKNVFQNQQ